jgi:beta-lactam-binding protein with PASTA domain
MRAVRALPVVIACAALLWTLAVGAFVAPQAWAEGEEIQVPALAGRTPEEARAALDALGLVTVLVPVAGPPVQRVERQDPAAGTRVSVGAQVVVRYGIALRLETRTPDLRGQLLGTVGPELEGAYTLEVELVYQPQRPDGQILQQNPAPGQPLWYRGVLSLTVAAAQPTQGLTAIVPPLVGSPEAEAVDLLKSLGLNVAIDYRQEPGQAPGTVLAQDPRSGAELVTGGTVFLRVSGPGGPPSPEVHPIPVPALAGLEMNAAIHTVQAHGFVPQLSFQVKAGHPAWRVFAQDPAAGTPRAAGSPVIISVALPGAQPAQVAMPVLFGLTQAQAQAILHSLGLSVNVELKNVGFPAGRVYGQEPNAGGLVPKGSMVVIKVAQGQPGPGVATMQVPAVVGLSPAQAWQKLVADGFTPKALQHMAPNEPVDVVDAQLPAPGSLAQVGAEVRFYVPLASVVPGLLGRTRTQAIQMLQADGFNANPQGPGFGVGTTVVIAQGAPAGVPLARGSTVSFAYKFQAGGGMPVKVQVPLLSGMTKEQAAAKLQQTGLGVDLERQGPIVPGPGTKVVAQTPNPGALVPVGTVVKVIYVEQGQLVLPVSVPTLLGKTKAQAKAQLDALGLVAKFNGPGGNPNKLRVVTQQPVAGTKLAPGSQVTMLVVPIP